MKTQIQKTVNQISSEKRMKVLRYLVTGGLTTAVSFITFWVFCYPLELDPNISNILSIICAVAFAYITNKVFVFRSKTEGVAELLKEAASFVLSRGITIILEIGLVYLLITILELDPMISKASITVLVVIMNYIFSQHFVFKIQD